MISGKIEAKIKIWRNVIFLFRKFFLCLLFEKFFDQKAKLLQKNCQIATLFTFQFQCKSGNTVYAQSNLSIVS